MKKRLLILSLMATGLSGCYIEPIRDHGGGYQRDRDHRDDSDRPRDRDHRDDGRGGERDDRDGYH
jgi:hypothetical protein